MARSRAAAASVHEDATTGRIFDIEIYKRLWRFARPYRARMIASVALLLVIAGCTLATPLFVRVATDDYLAADVSLAWDERVTGLGRIALFMLGFAALTFVTRYGQLYLTSITGQRIIYDVRNHVFEHIQRRSLRFFDRNPVGRLVTRVTTDVEALAELFSAGIDVVFYDLAMIGLIMSILFWVDVDLALWTLLLVPPLFLWSFLFKRQAQQLFRNVRSRVTRLNSYINECITGIRVIQLFRTEERTRERFQDWNGDLRDAHLATVKNFSLFYPGIEVLSSLGVATILVAGHHYVSGGTLTVGEMMLFWFLLHRFFEPLRQISEKYNVLQSAVASAERIFKILDDDAAIPDRPGAIPLSPAVAREAEIRFEDVHFAYDGETPVLRGIDFTVRPGEKIAIVGATGAGKTSIINVLARFYDVQKGSVRIGDHDVRDYVKRDLRRAIGIVLQDVFLFADTLRENLRLGDTSISDQSLLEACRLVHADRFVDSLEGGLDHEVQERGATFSLGEKQLIAFARTLVHDPPILVLDEATANIDTETEELIQDAIARLMERRTVIVIAHRLSTIKRVDRILVMHKGEIRESGTHAELIRAGGIYRRLYELQYRSGEEDEAA